MMVRATDTGITHLRRFWLYGFVGAVVVFLLAPSAVVLPMSLTDANYLEFPPRALSLRWYREYAGSTEWQSATWISLKTALLTVLIATSLGTLAAYGLHRAKGRLATALLVALATPLVVPVIFVAIGAFYLYARLNLLYTISGLVAVHVTLAVPFVIALVMAALMGVDENQEKAARSLGASRAWAFATVTFPQIRLSVMSAALLAFLTSFDEVIVALLISGGVNETLTRKMFTSLRDQLDPTIAAISSILILLSMIIVLLTQALQWRSRALS